MCINEQTRFSLPLQINISFTDSRLLMFFLTDSFSDCKSFLSHTISQILYRDKLSDVMPSFHHTSFFHYTYFLIRDFFNLSILFPSQYSFFPIVFNCRGTYSCTCKTIFLLHYWKCLIRPRQADNHRLSMARRSIKSLMLTGLQLEQLCSGLGKRPYGNCSTGLKHYQWAGTQ